MASTSTRCAIVTGAAQGIGRAIAIRLARDGYNVVVSDLAAQSTQIDEVVSTIKTSGGAAIGFFADVSQETDVDSLVQRAVFMFGHLDVMVANAGVAVLNSILDTTVEEWEHVFSINVKGTLLCYKAAAKEMIKDPKKGGRIIGACSLTGKKSAAFCSTYGSSKFAIRGLTQCAAAEWAPYNITVNAYSPGFIESPMLSSMDHRIGEMTGTGDNAFIERAKAQIAMKRTGSTDDVASAVSFLVSKEASYITGQSLTIDGGVWFD
ncbi:NAD-binding protein [Gymnopilus junonius]|uniref:NAD-binding protein n=1 Tax=Gymnopilus junonius TaxID=109634 RepID=A0A9P5NIU1_GYMJU|nr:NAD-binding protein [Gymnopilus junonius]